MITTLREVFGDTTRIRVIEALSDGLPMTTAEWAEEADVNVKYVYKELPHLEKLGLVKKYKNEQHPRQKLYVWNPATSLAKNIRKSVVTLALQKNFQRQEIQH